MSLVRNLNQTYPPRDIFFLKAKDFLMIWVLKRDFFLQELSTESQWDSAT